MCQPMRLRSIKTNFIFVFSLSLWFVSASLVEADTHPKFSVLQFKEDWSVIKDTPPEQQSPLDALKYIELDDDGDFWFSLGGQARERFESWSNFGFAEANDDSFFLTRLRLHGDLHLSEYFRVFSEGKAAFSS